VVVVESNLIEMEESINCCQHWESLAEFTLFLRDDMEEIFCHCTRTTIDDLDLLFYKHPERVLRDRFQQTSNCQTKLEDADLKVADYPFTAIIHHGTAKKENISCQDFFEVIKHINFAWTQLKDGCERVSIEGSRWEHNCGLMFAENAWTLAFIQDVVASLDINGKLRAWAVNEFDGYEDEDQVELDRSKVFDRPLIKFDPKFHDDLDEMKTMGLPLSFFTPGIHSDHNSTKSFNSFENKTKPRRKKKQWKTIQDNVNNEELQVRP
jgi:hypothetical protein